MRIVIGQAYISLNEQRAAEMKRETWIKDAIKTHAALGEKEQLEQIFSDAYDNICGKKEKKSK